MTYETLPLTISTSWGNVILWIFIALLMIGLFFVMSSIDGDGGVVAVFFTVAGIFVFVAITKLYYKETQGTVKEFCVKEEKHYNVISEINGIKYSKDNIDVCTERAKFVAVDNAWHRVVEK